MDSMRRICTVHHQKVGHFGVGTYATWSYREQGIDSTAWSTRRKHEDISQEGELQLRTCAFRIPQNVLTRLRPLLLGATSICDTHQCILTLRVDRIDSNCKVSRQHHRAGCGLAARELGPDSLRYRNDAPLQPNSAQPYLNTWWR